MKKGNSLFIKTVLFILLLIIVVYVLVVFYKELEISDNENENDLLLDEEVVVSSIKGDEIESSENKNKKNIIINTQEENTLLEEASITKETQTSASNPNSYVYKF